MKEGPPVVNVCTQEEIFRKMLELSQNKDELISIGKKSREWVLKTHHWESAIERYIGLYENILSKQ